MKFCNESTSLAHNKLIREIFTEKVDFHSLRCEIELIGLFERVRIQTVSGN